MKGLNKILLDFRDKEEEKLDEGLQEANRAIKEWIRNNHTPLCAVCLKKEGTHILCDEHYDEYMKREEKEMNEILFPKPVVRILTYLFSLFKVRPEHRVSWIKAPHEILVERIIKRIVRNESRGNIVQYMCIGIDDFKILQRSDKYISAPIPRIFGMKVKLTKNKKGFRIYWRKK